MGKNKNLLLEMKKISKDFYGNQVLKDVNLTLKPGEIIGLVGENGAGKSTLMNILFGNTVIHETGGYGGKIIFNGDEIQFSNPMEALKAGIGMVHQEFVLIPGFSAVENIMLNREPTKYNLSSEVFGDRLNLLDRSEMNGRSKKAIETLEVDLKPEMLVKEMPVGHRQFTEIAREIDRMTTKLLILDEPTAVLTESEADIVMKVIKKLSDQGIGIIFITHRLDEILNICHNIVILRDGEIQKELKPKKTDAREIAQYMVGRELAEQVLGSKDMRKFDEDIFEVKDLWVDMPGEQINGINFNVKKGEIFGIGGLTGQGKLGIANGIMGLYPAEGEVFFKDEKLVLNRPKDTLKKGIAFVSEDRRGLGLLLDQSLNWNIAFTAMQIKEDFINSYLGGLIKWRDDETITEVAREYIDKLQIKCVGEKQLARELSGGNQQKICLAKAFVLNPDLMFVSEPTRGIDVGAKRLVLETLKSYNRKYGTTIIITSSELEELRSVSDRIAIINEGKIAGILPPTVGSVEFGLLMLGKSSEVKEGVNDD